MGVRVDVQVQRRTLFAISRAGHEFDAIGHDDLDHVVVGMDIGLHASVSGKISKEPSGEPAALSIRARITRVACQRKPVRARVVASISTALIFSPKRSP